MPKLFAIVLVLIGAIGGAAGGYFVKQSGGSAKAHAGEATNKSSADAHSDQGHKQAKQPKDDGHGGKSDGEAASYGFNNGLNYFKFSRQFVVPIIVDDGVKSLVLLDLNLEMDASAAESFYVREPKLRDALMNELLDIANQGRFNGVLTDRRNLELIRVDLLNTMHDVEGESVHDVLILDIMRQDL
ncbi:MAG: flagellar basal body-associated protein FliL [Alphaproteobacteria bacterium]|nr:flagellar basal body-associated protein FliL [Alphaproteobacteria bacterium]